MTLPKETPMIVTTADDGRSFNKGTPYGVRREYSRIAAVVSPQGFLSSHHWIKSEEDGPGVKRGEWLLGNRVSGALASHFIIHEITVVRAKERVDA